MTTVTAWCVLLYKRQFVFERPYTEVFELLEDFRQDVYEECDIFNCCSGLILRDYLETDCDLYYIAPFLF